MPYETRLFELLRELSTHPRAMMRGRPVRRRPVRRGSTFSWQLFFVVRPHCNCHVMCIACVADHASNSHSPYICISIFMTNYLCHMKLGCLSCLVNCQHIQGPWWDVIGCHPPASPSGSQPPPTHPPPPLESHLHQSPTLECVHQAGGGIAPTGLVRLVRVMSPQMLGTFFVGWSRKQLTQSIHVHINICDESFMQYETMLFELPRDCPTQLNRFRPTYNGVNLMSQWPLYGHRRMQFTVVPHNFPRLHRLTMFPWLQTRYRHDCWHVIKSVGDQKYVGGIPWVHVVHLGNIRICEQITIT